MGVQLLSTRSTPALPVFPNPVEQRPFKSDIVAESFGLEPFVFQNFLPLRQKFLIKTGLLYEFPRRRRLLSWMSHASRMQ